MFQWEITVLSKMFVVLMILMAVVVFDKLQQELIINNDPEIEEIGLRIIL